MNGSSSQRHFARKVWACDIVPATNEASFRQALAANTFDVIIADDRLREFDGRSAQRIASALEPSLPILVVSGTLSEEIAVERPKSGAVDDVLKQRLTRVPGSIRRAIAEARMRDGHARAEAEIRRLNADLERRVLERTTQLAEANRALEEREQALSQSEARCSPCSITAPP